MLELIYPNWPAPPSVKAVATTRKGGFSRSGFASLNLATHVADDPERVLQNRERLSEFCNLPGEPCWLQQTHSTRVVALGETSERDADAAISQTPGQVAVVLTADCLPVLFCNKQGSEVAAAHAGWRGLLNGILEQTLQSMQSNPEDCLVWLGAAIGPEHFEVGDDVRQAFVAADRQAETCFKATRPGHYLADLYALARLRLTNQGVGQICGGEYCTYAMQERFFSYRRERVCGRQASLIYLCDGNCD